WLPPTLFCNPSCLHRFAGAVYLRLMLKSVLLTCCFILLNLLYILLGLAAWPGGQGKSRIIAECRSKIVLRATHYYSAWKNYSPSVASVCEEASTFAFRGRLPAASAALPVSASASAPLSMRALAAAASFSASSSLSRLRSSRPSWIALAITEAIRLIDLVASSLDGIGKSMSV